ncbi:LysR substrate-binding domain-containing protein, partial [Thalassobaculum sp.]
RHGNLSRAAEALHVTHGAVSKQITALEAWLGTPVFERTARGLIPTEAGTVLAPVVAQAFDALADGVRRVRRGAGPSTLTISVLPSFAAHWLIHRLPRFLDRHPGIDVRFFTTRRVVDLTREDVDLAIRYGRGDWPGVHAEKFLEESLTPVYAPAFLDRHPGRAPMDLLRHAIHSHHNDDINWRRWREAAGLPADEIPAASEYDDTAVAMQAVLGGQGIMLGRSALIRDDLAAGRLVRVSEIDIPSTEANYMVCLERSRSRAAVRAFRDWLVEEARDA